MNTLNRENDSLNKAKLLFKKHNTIQPILKDDEEFHQYVNKGQRMMQILRERLIETSEGNFILNSNLMANQQTPKQNERSNSGSKTLILSRQLSSSNYTSRGECSKYVFETMFRSKFDINFKNNINQSQMLTTRETTTRTRNAKRNSITLFDFYNSNKNDLPSSINLNEEIKNKCKSICRIKPIPFNPLKKKSANRQNSVTIFTNTYKREPVTLVYKDKKK